MTTAVQAGSASSSRDPADTGGPVGRTALGSISISERAVSKIAARAALEIADAGAAASRVLGVAVPGGAQLGLRGTDLSAPPKVSVEVDGEVAFVDLQLAVRWPASIATVTGQVRDHVIERVAGLTGLRVQEVHITVADLVTDLAPPPRVR